MLKKIVLAGIMVTAAACGAQAASVVDATGDFIGSYTGPHQDDLDVTSFGVSYDGGTSSFLIHSTMAGTIDPALGGFYVIGVNTGTGAGPFASIGAPNVLFNKVIVVQKNGTAAISGTPLAAGSVTITGNALDVRAPLSLLPSTGFTPLNYGFNIWPRSGAGGLEVISDFAPNNATVASAPEPASWGMMIVGFGAIGGAMRRRRFSFA